MSLFPIFLKSIHIAKKAVAEDDKENYEEAVKLYEQCEAYICYVIKHEARCDESRNIVRSKLKIYQDRIKQLKSCLDKKEICSRRKQRSPYFRVNSKRS